MELSRYYNSLLEAINNLRMVEEQNEAILKFFETDNQLLEKYKACHEELNQYLATSPHDEENGLDLMKQRIDMIKQVDKSIVEAGKAVESLQDYGDRDEIDKVREDYENKVKDAQEKMRFVDLYKYKLWFDDVPMRVKKVHKTFDQDYERLLSIQKELEEKKPDMWKEDNERLLGLVNSWLQDDSKKADIDLEGLEGQIEKAKTDKADLVKSTVELNPWLRNNKYASRYEKMTADFVSRADFDAWFGKRRSEHRKTVFKWVAGAVAVALVLIVFRFGSVQMQIIASVLILLIVGIIYSRSTKKDKQPKKD